MSLLEGPNMTHASPRNDMTQGDLLKDTTLQEDLLNDAILQEGRRNAMTNEGLQNGMTLQEDMNHQEGPQKDMNLKGKPFDLLLSSSFLAQTGL